MRLRVIGVGSPQGDDAAGLAVARRLAAQRLPGGAEVVVRERPGLDLLDDLRDVDGVVLVDALRAGGAPGTLRWLAPEALAAQRGLSSHALGVGPVLALAHALGVRPALRVLGVEAGPARGAGLSPELEDALPQACRAVRAALAELCRRPGGSDAGAPRA